MKWIFVVVLVIQVSSCGDYMANTADQGGASEEAEDGVAEKRGIKLLEGYRHEIHRRDTIAGKIWQPDGMTIRYDIGYLAGPRTAAVSKENRAWERVQVIAGRSVHVVDEINGYIIVTIAAPLSSDEPSPPDRSREIYPANFFANANSPEEWADLLLTALSYSPE